MQAEVAYLTAAWSAASERRRAPALIDRVVTPDVTIELDRFGRVQLEEVLGVCRTAPSLSAAGRVLFDRSRERKKIANDADRCASISRASISNGATSRIGSVTGGIE